ncbi:MAG: efflux RND transporter permease subunit, partial [Burkholderiales bacterium]
PGAGARHSAGTGVMGGMLAATFLAIFLIPWFYKLIVDRRLSDPRSTEEIEHEVAHHREQALRAVHVPRRGLTGRGTEDAS